MGNVKREVFPESLAAAKIGTWKVEFDEGRPPRMYGDGMMMRLVGLEPDTDKTPEEVFEFWHSRVDPAHYEAFDEGTKYMVEGEHAEIQYPWHHPDGRTIVVRCGGIRDMSYTAGIRILGVHQWVTTMKHVDRELEAQQRMLNDALTRAAEANRAKTVFLNNMSHDIRTPMNAIIGYAGLAERHIDSQEMVKEYLDKISQSSDHLLSLINDILDMARIESGKMVLDGKPWRLAEIVRSVQTLVKSQADARKIAFTADIRTVEDKVIVCDRLRFTQVLLNIITNAIKYTPEGGTVAMRIEESSSGHFIISVKDSGIGMEEEFVKKIFEPFSRAQDTTTSGIQGVGLGMSIVKNIVDMMGGAISVKSEIGKGTEVTIAIAFAIGRLDNEAADDSADEEKSAKTCSVRHILLVEDNGINREIATSILLDNGFEVDTAENGQIAVEKVKRNNDPASAHPHYDLVLMDIQMPVMNGYEATRAIRAWERSLGEGYVPVPIVAMTANAFAEDREEALAAGMNEHLPKPIKVKQLIECVTSFG